MEQTALNQTYEQALQFHQNGQFAEAEKLYQEILEAAPGMTGIYGNLTEVYFRQGKGDAALALLQRAERQYPKDLGVLTAMCAFYAQIRQLDMAIEYALRAVENYPEYADCYQNLGNLYYQSGQTEPALAAFRKCISLNPQSTNSYLNLGIMLFGQKELSAAAEAFENVIALAPGLAQGYLNLGVVRIEQTKLEEAEQLLQKTISLAPSMFDAYKRLGMVLHAKGDYNKAVEHYEKAMEKGEQGAEIEMLLANGYRDMDEVEKAVKHYKKVLELDPENDKARSNIKYLYSKKIAVWHFEMLADSARNDAYYQTILRQVKKGDVVLDIGTGSGLLAMMAVKAGAKKVYACELVPALAEIAKQIVTDNGMSDQIEIFNMKSTALKIGEHLPERADVVVSEILDCGVLGEGVLPSLRDAYQNLLKPGARAVPLGVDIYGTLVETDHLKKVFPVKKISGFDLSAFEDFRADRGYVRIDLRSVPHRRLSDVFSLQSVNFKNLPEIYTKDNPLKKQLNVPVTTDGTAHAVVFWFTLHLDEKTSLSTGPEGEMIHWGQAIYFFKNEKEVKAGEQLEFTMLQSDLEFGFE